MNEPLLKRGAISEDDHAVNGGVFFVKQTHLGFCPPDVILHVRPKGLVILNDDHEVAEYKFTNMVMWSQSRAVVTIMLQSNLKRVELNARGRLMARKIVTLMRQLTEKLSDHREERMRFWGVTSADLESGRRSGDAAQSADFANPADMLESTDHSQVDLNGFKMFAVKQTHLPDHPPVVMLRIDREGVGLTNRHTGELIWSCPWQSILLWRGDGAAVVIVFSHSNRQMQLLSEKSEVIIETMARTAMAVKQSMEKDFVKHVTLTATHRLPAAQLSVRRALMDFEPVRVEPHAKWRDQGRMAKVRQLLPFASGGILESIQAREQLHAIFALIDEDGGGTLDIDELAQLMRSLGIHGEDGREMSKLDLELIMLDMDAFNDEVSFDGFVQWALGTTTGAAASELLKKRVEHRQKEVQATAMLFDQLDADGDGMIDRADFKEFIKFVGLSLNDKEFYEMWVLIDQDRSGEVSLCVQTAFSFAPHFGRTFGGLPLG